MELKVWAPNAKSVILVADGADVSMEGQDSGDWVATVDIPDGARYGFRLDGSDRVLPDPRSRRQPDGVHELSAMFDPSVYDWQDDAWTGRPLAGGLIYELHIGTFTPAGTFDSAIEKLDHLVSIGVDFVEVLPVNGFNGTHNWGYDGVLWYTVHEQYGGPAGYQRFVDACHQRGLAVLQDVVYNHLGPSGNYLPEFGPYLHEASANTWGASVNLDGPDSEPVRRFILDNALMWLRDYHVDGLRLDAVHALVDHRTVHLLAQMATEVDALSAHVRRPLTLIAESDMNDPTLITAREAGGYGLTAQWSDDFHHALHVSVTGETTGYYSDFACISALVKVLTSAFFHDGTYSSFRGRHHGRPVEVETMPSYRFVVFGQNHDQIGNRAIGDRMTAQVGPASLAIAAVLLFTSPFTPMLFMGEEWAASTPWQFFSSHPEEELGRLTAEGRIAEFAEMGWDPAVVPDPQQIATFNDSKLNWSEAASGDHARVLDLYRRLAVLRRQRPELTDPRLHLVRTAHDDTARWLSISRGDVRVLVNFAAEEQQLPLLGTPGPVLLETAPGTTQDGEHAVVPGLTAVIIGPVVT